MDIETVKQAALNNFAEYGYEETSLAMIAGDLGIKKQSLATYFASKKQLFFAVFEDEYRRQKTFIDTLFDRDLSLHDLLYGFLNEYKEQFEKDHGAKFWLRMTLFEKVALDKKMRPQVYDYLDHLKARVEVLFAENSPAANAFVGVFDSLCLELLFGGKKRASERLNDTWIVYWRGINAEGRSNV